MNERRNNLSEDWWLGKRGERSIFIRLNPRTFRRQTCVEERPIIKETHRNRWRESIIHVYHEVKANKTLQDELVRNFLSGGSLLTRDVKLLEDLCMALDPRDTDPFIPQGRYDPSDSYHYFRSELLDPAVYLSCLSDVIPSFWFMISERARQTLQIVAEEMIREERRVRRLQDPTHDYTYY